MHLHTYKYMMMIHGLLYTKIGSLVQEKNNHKLIKIR